MRIVLDAMGGDHAPEEIVKGALKACNNMGSTIILVGQKKTVDKYWKKPSNGMLEIVNATQVISSEDSPVSSIRQKRDSSMVKGIKLLKEGAHAFISAGNTGALVAGSLLLLGRIPGVDRPAIASVIPTLRHPTLLLDIGANSDVKPKNLVQFALMGRLYAEEILGRENPKVGLLNIGVERDKGNVVTKSAYASLDTFENLVFGGNVEAREFFDGDFDVVVTDGFTGNIFLKAIEGFGSFMLQSLKRETRSRAIYTLGGALMKPAIENIKVQLDYSEYGGAILLGLSGLVIKAHGSSKSKAIYNAICAAERFYKAGVLERIADSMQ